MTNAFSSEADSDMIKSPDRCWHITSDDEVILAFKMSQNFSPFLVHSDLSTRISFDVKGF